MHHTNRQWRLASYPQGIPTENNWTLEEGPIPEPGADPLRPRHLPRRRPGRNGSAWKYSIWVDGGQPSWKKANATRESTGCAELGSNASGDQIQSNKLILSC